MKVEKNNNIQSIKYPCLLQGVAGSIILMTSYGVGTCLTNAEKYGQESMESTYADWDMNNFKIFEGEITFSN